MQETVLETRLTYTKPRMGSTLDPKAAENRGFIGCPSNGGRRLIYSLGVEVEKNGKSGSGGAAAGG